MQIPESKESLWVLTVSPLIWVGHFLLSYLTAAIWCAKFAGPDGSLTPVRIGIGAYTVVGLIGIGLTGYWGYRRHRYGRADLPHEASTAEDRHRFLGFATLLLSGLSAVAVVFVALPALYFYRCH